MLYILYEFMVKTISHLSCYINLFDTSIINFGVGMENIIHATLLFFLCMLFEELIISIPWTNNL